MVVSSVVAPEELELLDESSFAEQAMTVRLKRDMRIMYKTLFNFFLNTKSKILLFCILGGVLYIRRTLLIPRFERFYKNVGILLGGCLTVKN